MDLVQLRQRAEGMLGVPGRLHDYQWDGVSFLYRSPCALLADEMGLGKTVQTSVALALLLSTCKDINRALIVAPAALKLNWLSELEKWVPTLTVRNLSGNSKDREALYMLPIPVLVSSYEQIRLDGLDRIPSNCFDIVVLDEAQRIKNSWSRTALCCRLLPRKYAWALSATPLENDRQDTIALLRFLDPKIKPNIGKQDLSSNLKKMMLRRHKSEVREQLPPVIVQDLKLELSHLQKIRYDDVWMRRNQAAKAKKQELGASLLGVITRLKIICNIDRDSGASSKFEILNEICEGVGNEARILVFSQFVETLKWIATKISFPCDMLTGKMSAAERYNSMERFKLEPSPRVLLVSLKAGGVGLNLGEATHVVLFDRWWNPAVEMQAVYRAHRFDRAEPLHVFRFLVVDTIEERIASILAEKESVFENTIESVGTVAPTFPVLELARILDIDPTELYSYQNQPTNEVD